MFPLKVETTHNWATDEDTLAAGDVRYKCKQMTPPSVAGALATCTPIDRKSQEWMEFTNVVTCKKGHLWAAA